MTAFFLCRVRRWRWRGLVSAPDLSPAIIHSSAASHRCNSAVLKATVNPKGLDTTAWFVYSKDPNLASNVTTTPNIPMGSGSTDNHAIQGISGLEAGKTYYYRAMAHNSAGTKSGDILTFNTLPLASVVTGSATSITERGRPSCDRKP